MAGSSYIRISLTTLAVSVLCASAAISQEQPCTIRKLPVSFRDAENLPLQNVSVNDLEAKVHGQPVNFLSLAPDPRPHRIVLLLDTSGSMGSIVGERALWNLELFLARHFFVVNQKTSQIALLFFSNKVTDETDFAQGNTAVGTALQKAATDRDYVKTHIKGQTALWDAIFEGVQLLNHPSSADAVYVLTDGADNVSRHSARELGDRLAVSSVRLFAVLLRGEYRSRVPGDISAPSELPEIARKSGGEILTAAERRADRVALSADVEGKQKTEETLARLYRTIFQDNLLEIQLPFPNAKAEHWELRLSEAARRKWKGAHITYPDTLISCDSEVVGSGRN